MLFYCYFVVFVIFSTHVLFLSLSLSRVLSNVAAVFFFCYKRNAVYVSLCCLFIMLAGTGLGTLQNRPDFQNSIVHTQLIMEPLMYRIIKCADYSRNLFYFWWNGFLENDVRKWNVNTSATQSQCFGKFSGNLNLFSFFSSFRFYFCVFFCCFLKRVCANRMRIGQREMGYGIISKHKMFFHLSSFTIW